MKVIIATMSAVVAFFTCIFTIVAMAGLFTFLTGCGTYEIPKTEVVEAPGQCGEERVCTSDEEKGGETDTNTSNENLASESPDDYSDITEEDISVTTEENEELVEKTKFIFVPKSKTWYEHVENTPDGYRLASRSDVIKTLETGEFDELLDTDETLWTSTDSEQLSEMAWVVGFYNDFTVMKTLEFPALFIAE